jgi:putative ubiquitin-RnfH superfamily antitoxin RatB of RatAB toxin-antitoxin module
MTSVRVEVVYALAGRQDIVTSRVAEGTTAGEAVRASGFAAAGLRIGIGGKEVSAARILRDGDRVELLRPLAADPKEARRARARRRSFRVRV